MKRLQKRLQQLEAKLRYMSKKLSASKLFGIIRQILAVEVAIERLNQPKSDLEIAKAIATDYDGNLWTGYGKTRVYFNITGFRKKFYIEVKDGNLDLTHAPVKVAFAIRYAA